MANKKVANKKVASKKTGNGQNTRRNTALGSWEAGLRPTTVIEVSIPPNGCNCAWSAHGNPLEGYSFTLKYRNASCPVRRNDNNEDPNYHQ